MDKFLVSDFVQVRRTSEGEPVEVAEGYVVAVEDGLIILGTQEYYEVDGWVCELISRALVFPTTLGEISATLVNDEVVVLMGRGEVWTTDEGVRVLTSNIKSFEVI